MPLNKKVRTEIMMYKNQKNCTPFFYYKWENTSDCYYGHHWVWGLHCDRFTAISLSIWRGWLYELHPWLDHLFLKLTLDYSQSQKLLRNRNVVHFSFSVVQPSVCHTHIFFSKETWTKTKETTMILLAAVTYWAYTMCDALSYRHSVCDVIVKPSSPFFLIEMLELFTGLCRKVYFV